MVLPAIAAALVSALVTAGANKFLSGTPEKRENISTLRRSQEPNYRNLQNAAMGKPTEGSFGDYAKYLQDLMSNDPEAMKRFEAPELRRFNEDIIPGLAEQFAGMGAGGLSSSGFRNAAVSAGTDLSERLGAIREGLRMQGAQGLFNLGQASLQNFSNPTTTQPGSEGFLSSVIPGVAQAGTTWALNKWGNQQTQPNEPAVTGGSITAPRPEAIAPKTVGASNWLQTSPKGKSSPYGGSLRLPNFNPSMR